MVDIKGGIPRIRSQREDAVSISVEHKTDPNARYSSNGKFQVPSHLLELNAAQLKHLINS